MHLQLSKAKSVSLKVWTHTQTFWSPIVLQSIKNSSQRLIAALTWNDKHKTVYTSYKCYFWWQWGIKTELKAKGRRDLACDQNARRLVRGWKKWDAHDKSALTAVLKSNRENSTIKKTIRDHRSQAGASVGAVFSGVIQTRLLIYLYSMWTVITWGVHGF